MPVMPSCSYSATISSDNSRDFTLSALLVVLDPEAPAYERALGNVIRTLAKYIRYVPVRTANEDLETLLTVSIALARCGR
jgi:hypothetical protein